jgi:hypothetical protein
VEGTCWIGLEPINGQVSSVPNRWSAVLRPDVLLEKVDFMVSDDWSGIRSCTVVDGGAAALYCSDPLEGLLPNASGHEVSLATPLRPERLEFPSFQGLAGQFFSGVEGATDVSLVVGIDSWTCGATLVEECSCVFVGKKSVVSMLDRLGFCERIRCPG